MPKIIDITGETFGRLTVTGRSTGVHTRVSWHCICTCGNEIDVASCHLRGGHTKSCGCILSDANKRRLITHGKSSSKLYRTWRSIKVRCNNTSQSNYMRYGGRGIKVCDEWINSFESFYRWSIDNGYDENLTIDRIDNNSNYEPSNCRWVDLKTQAYNKRTTKYITYDHNTHTIPEWCTIYNIREPLVRCRLARGWTFERAFELNCEEAK